ncbi:hypothetical protein Barb4_01124 [Bacteroidales bacterium Barb4]|nr:hypothetical protein Barb4_01124 [Bacteroidales bacterium Barb4]
MGMFRDVVIGRELFAVIITLSVLIGLNKSNIHRLERKVDRLERKIDSLEIKLQSLEVELKNELEDELKDEIRDEIRDRVKDEIKYNNRKIVTILPFAQSISELKRRAEEETEKCNESENESEYMPLRDVHY